MALVHVAPPLSPPPPPPGRTSLHPHNSCCCKCLHLCPSPSLLLPDSRCLAHPHPRLSSSTPQPTSRRPHFGSISLLSVRSSTLDSSFPLSDSQSRSFHELPSGLNMEVIEQLPTRVPHPYRLHDEKPPIVFLHGSYHAAWCWAVHWLPFFSAKGHQCYALSFLGQGESDTPNAGVGGTLESHARDVAHFIRHRVLKDPVLVGHSFGGLVVQQYLARISHLRLDSESTPLSSPEGWDEPYPSLTAAILACSVPPTGNGPLIQRYLITRPIDSIKVTLSLAAKGFAYSKSLCRDTFFSSNIPSSLLDKYQQLLARSSNVPLFNLRELNASLPVDAPSKDAPPVLVIGAENDFVVDVQGLRDTADVYGKNMMVIPSIAHDIMLDVAWKDAANAVVTWLEQLSLQLCTKKR